MAITNAGMVGHADNSAWLEYIAMVKNDDLKAKLESDLNMSLGQLADMVRGCPLAYYLHWNPNLKKFKLNYGIDTDTHFQLGLRLDEFYLDSKEKLTEFLDEDLVAAGDYYSRGKLDAEERAFAQPGELGPQFNSFIDEMYELLFSSKVFSINRYTSQQLAEIITEERWKELSLIIRTIYSPMDNFLKKSPLSVKYKTDMRLTESLQLKLIKALRSNQLRISELIALIVTSRYEVHPSAPLLREVYNEYKSREDTASALANTLSSKELARFFAELHKNAVAGA